MKKILFFLEKYLASALLLALGATLRFHIKGEFPSQPALVAAWHRNMIPLLYRHRGIKVGILISSSDDGQLIAGPCETLGYVTIRGSSTRGGSQAIRRMITHAQSHHCAITPDGPKGPSQEMKDGLLYLAYVSKLPIVPAAVDISSEWVFNSWDRFRFPKPFARVNISYGAPVCIQTKEEIKTKLSVVQDAMDRLSEKNKIERG